MLDREHVLPKSKPSYKPFSFAIWNLGIACKRCNMEYKKSRTDFVVDSNDTSLLQKSEGYCFIHPNFDFYTEHLSRYAEENDDGVIVKYSVMAESAKGAYTYKYFNLRGLEVSSFDRAQGIASQEAVGELAQEVRLLANSFGQ